MTKKAKSLGKMVEAKFYKLEEAVALLKTLPKAKFDETVEVHLKLGIDPKQGEQMVRGSIVLPHGIGKSRKVAVVAKGEKLKEAETAGADATGSDDLIEKISKGSMDFDVLVATPDVMKDLAKLGKILGPKGLMPNPKSGTVTFEVGHAVKELKAGRVEFKNDSFGIIHSAVGKLSFAEDKLIENIKVFIETIIKSKPATSKGQYIKSITLSSTMGPGLKLDINQKF